MRARADAVRAQLDAGTVPVDQAGDATLLPRGLENASTREIARRFGEPFATALQKVSADGGWHGPIQTEYGLHLLNVSARDAGGALPLTAVRQAVAREWGAAQRAEAKAKFYAALRSRYTVSVEPAAEDKAAAPKR